MRFFKHFIDWKRIGPHPLRKFLFVAVMVIFAVSLLAIFLPMGVKNHPTVVAYGFMSFGASFMLVWISGVLYGIISTIYGYRKYPALWKPSADKSFAGRYKHSLQQRRLRDPFLDKIGKLWSNFGIACFIIWFVQLLIVSVILIKKGY